MFLNLEIEMLYEDAPVRNIRKELKEGINGSGRIIYSVYVYDMDQEPATAHRPKNEGRCVWIDNFDNEAEAINWLLYS